MFGFRGQGTVVMSVQSTSRSVGVNAGMLVVEGERKVYRMYATVTQKTVPMFSKFALLV